MGGELPKKADPAKAMRFARELDAAAFARFYVAGVPVRICQHEWS